MMQGMEELEAAIHDLANEFPRQVSTASVNAALGVMVRALQRAAPTGKTGKLRRSPGKTVKRRSDGAAGKAGFDVGQSAATKDVRGPHAHLYYLGTQKRYRTGSKGKPPKGIGGRYRPVEMLIRRGVYAPDVAKYKRRTGSAPAHSGMASVLNAAVPDAMQAMVNVAEKKLQDLTERGK